MMAAFQVSPLCSFCKALVQHVAFVCSFVTPRRAGAPDLFHVFNSNSNYLFENAGRNFSETPRHPVNPTGSNANGNR